MLTDLTRCPTRAKLWAGTAPQGRVGRVKNTSRVSQTFAHFSPLSRLQNSQPYLASIHLLQARQPISASGKVTRLPPEGQEERYGLIRLQNRSPWFWLTMWHGGEQTYRLRPAPSLLALFICCAHLTLLDSSIFAAWRWANPCMPHFLARERCPRPSFCCLPS